MALTKMENGALHCQVVKRLFILAKETRRPAPLYSSVVPLSRPLSALPHHPPVVLRHVSLERAHRHRHLDELLAPPFVGPQAFALGVVHPQHPAGGQEHGHALSRRPVGGRVRATGRAERVQDAVTQKPEGTEREARYHVSAYYDGSAAICDPLSDASGEDGRHPIPVTVCPAVYLRVGRLPDRCHEPGHPGTERVARQDDLVVLVLSPGEEVLDEG